MLECEGGNDYDHGDGESDINMKIICDDSAINRISYCSLTDYHSTPHTHPHPPHHIPSYLHKSILTHIIPSITPAQFSPKSGPQSGGTEITITGTNLGADRSDILSVRIDGVNCPVTDYQPGIR